MFNLYTKKGLIQCTARLIQRTLIATLVLTSTYVDLSFFGFDSTVSRAYAAGDPVTVIVLNSNGDGTCGSGCFTLPANWNNASNTIEVLGPGGNGVDGGANGTSGSGGGGGAYAKVTNVSFAGTTTASFNVGTGGSGSATWFGSTGTVSAGAGGNGGGGVGGAGGTVQAGTGFSGGSGGNGNSTKYNSGAGGGGAGGPNGAGGAGGDSSTTAGHGGSGGGGSGGGSAGSVATSATGANGGNNSVGSGGGTGSGGNGSNGGGGAGGLGINAAGTAGAGGNGSKGSEWTGAGVGGGSGGGGGNARNAGGNGGNAGTVAANSGAGGGGGGGAKNTAGLGATGADGVIIITYTPTPLPNPPFFSSAPTPASASSISMTISAVSASTTPAQYYVAATSSTCGANYGTGFTDSGWQTSTSYTDSGLQANKCYGYTVTARSASSTTGATSTASTTYTHAATPSAPTLASVGTSTLILTNNENGNPLSNPTTNFTIYVSGTSPNDSTWEGKYVTSGGAPSATPQWLTDAQLTNLTITGLTPGTSYNFYSLARNQNSINSGTSTAAATSTTEATPPSPNPPYFSSTPSPSSTSDIGMTSVTATDASSPVSYYFGISTGTCGANFGTGGTDSGWQTGTSHTDSGLQTNKCYAYTVTAKDALGNTTATSTASTTYTLAATPTAPTLTSVGTSSLRVTNNENGNPASNPTTNFTMYVSGSSPNDTTWEGRYVNASGNPSATPVWLTDAQLTTLLINDLNSDTSYSFYAQARNANNVLSGTSTAAATTTIEATIPSPNPPYFSSAPAPVSDVAVTMTSVTTTDISSPVQYYFTAVTGSCGASLGTGGTDSGWQTGTSYTDIGLQANKCYAHTVTSRDALGNTGATSTASSTYTHAAVPAAPTLASVGTSTLSLTNNENGNPTANPSTSFTIYVTSSDGTWNGRYVASDGTANASPQWLSDAQLTALTVKNLTYNTSYSFYSVARNQNNIVTATSSVAATTTASLDSIFSSAPSPIGTSSISMTATAATAPNGVQYYFAVNNTSCGANAGTGGTDSGWQASTSYTDSGLQTNKCYGYTVTARDALGVFYGATSSASTTYTLAATPTSPTLSSVGTSTLTFTNNEGFNPVTNPATNFTVYVTSADGTWNGRYVTSGGSPSATPQWLTDAQLTALSVTGLTYNTSYSFSVQARNQNSILSGTSTATATTTLADTFAPTPTPTFASAPAPASASSISMTSTVASDDNGPVQYYFALDNTSCGANAGTGGTDSGWQTSTSYTDTGLQANKCYGYKVTARDTLGNTTATSAVSITYTNAAQASAPTLASVTETTLVLTNNENGNPSSNPTTDFTIYVTTADGTWSNKYVDASGNPQATPQWLTDAQLTGLTVSGLTGVTSYTFYSIARNANSIASATSSGTATTTLFGGSAGNITLADHSDGQIGNQFILLNNSTDTTIFSFAMTPAGESGTTTSVQINLSGIANIDNTNVSNIRLYRDNNSDSALDGGDTAVGGTGVLSITDATGTITFSTAFLATTTIDYIVVADLSEVHYANRMLLELTTSGVSATGVLSGGPMNILGTVSSIQHRKGMPPVTGGTDNAGDNIGDAAPGGTTIRSGGGGGGGGRQSAVGDETVSDGGGETIGNEPGFMAPAETGALVSMWSNANNAFTSDGTYAISGVNDAQQSYGDFSFNIPPGNVITGISLKLEAQVTADGGTLDADLSWNNGGSWTSSKSTATLTTGDVVHELGGPGDTWGHSWTVNETTNGTFHVRLTFRRNANGLGVDAIQVKVFHQATGGGGGAGDAI